MGEPFSKFIVYVDEAGDHGPAKPEFPVFVLALCVFEKADYTRVVTNAMHGLKFKYFGHDTVVFHEREIRKAQKPFDILQDAGRRSDFMADLNALVDMAPFTLIAAVIRKDELAKRHRQQPPHVYNLALRFGLERLEHMRVDAADTGTVHVVFEARGKREDEELELEFRRICSSNLIGRQLDFHPTFSKKAANHCGLQLADLVARPIGLHVMRPDQSNRAYEIIETKFRRSRAGQVSGYGLKIYP